MIPKITKENLGEILLKHRFENSKTQLEISKKTGVSLPTIIGIEAGRITPQTMTIYKFRKYFKQI